MLTWILLALAIYYVSLFLAPSFLLLRIGIPAYVGSRDSVPEPGVLHGRAIRATRNLQENLAPFLALAILALVVPEVDMPGATMGAAIFVIARAVYLPLYLLAVPWIRSASFVAGWIGLVMMALALV